MKILLNTVLLILVAVALNGVMAWVVFTPGRIRDPFALFMLVILFVAPNIGTIWMLYMAIRFERHSLPFALLAFVPYAFLWYYFQRVRPKKHLTREQTA